VSFATWLHDWRSVRVFTLFFAWALLLVPSFLIFNEVFLPVIISIDLVIFTLPFLYPRFFDYNGFTRFQLFYIIPLLVSTSLNTHYWRAEYLLQIIVMFSVAFICAIEIAQNARELRYSWKSCFLFSLTLFFTWIVSEVSLHYADLSKYITLCVALLVFGLVHAPADKLSEFEGFDPYRKWKIIGFILAIVAVHVGIFVNGKSNFLFYVLYVFSVINLGFLCKDDKKDFLLLSVIIIILSLTPFGPKEVHFDSLILSCIFVLFHLRSPILYYKKTKYGIIKVEYDYVHNKILLVNDGIIQGERFLDNTASLRVRYFGGRDAGSIIFNVFNLLKGTNSNMAVLGLGTGTLAMFGRKGQTIHFYEINPEVVKVAYDRRYFDYIAHSDAKIKIILGEAREKLTEAKDSFYSLICVDVYLGSSMPSHFLTLEAVQTYLEKLTKDGIILIHITGHKVETFEKRISAIANKLKLEGVVAYERYIEHGAKKRNNYGMVVLPKHSKVRHRLLEIVEYVAGIKLKSSEAKEEIYSWVVLTKSKKHISSLMEEKRWYKLDLKEKSILYTDDMINYSVEGSVIADEVD